MADVIKTSKECLEAIVQMYDRIVHLDNAFKACQSSVFRKQVLELQRANAGFFGALTKRQKTGVEIKEYDARDLIAFDAALTDADRAYANDTDGHLNYRNYVRSVIHAPINVRLMETVRNLITE